jgi:hypothetical protein
MPICQECGGFFKGKHWMEECPRCYHGEGPELKSSEEFYAEHGAGEVKKCLCCGKDFQQRYSGDPACSDCIRSGMNKWRTMMEGR